MEETALQYINLYGVIAIFVMMSTNGFASTPPSEAVYGLAGVLVHSGRLSMTAVLLAGVAGNLFGTTLLFAVGRAVGYGWLIRLRTSLIERAGIVGRAASGLPEEPFYLYIKDLLARKGLVYVGLLRCFPIIRSIISLPAGMLRMPVWLFLLYTTAGCSVWAVAWVQFGFLVGESWRNWSQWVTVALLVLLIGLLFLAKSKIKESYGLNKGK